MNAKSARSKTREIAMTDELTIKILREIAEPGSGALFSRREAARHAADTIEHLSRSLHIQTDFVTLLRADLAAVMADSAEQVRIAKDACERANRLMRFAGLVLKAHRNDGWPGDVDGDDLQDWALRCGLIEERQMSEPCGETCTCAEVADFPTTCYFNTELGKAVIVAAAEQG
jgi:hypothetical protein